MSSEPVTTLATRPRVRSVLFVCTGNTCRSPLAEVICRALLAKKLACPVAELPARGFMIHSAGLMAFPGDTASAQAIEVARELEQDLANHRSQPVNPELLANATDVITMTRAHQSALLGRFPDTGPYPRLLCGDEDLPDPIGGELDEYRACAATIRKHLTPYLAEWLET